jgi:uncharacterized membrane protein YjdF
MDVIHQKSDKTTVPMYCVLAMRVIYLIGICIFAFLGRWDTIVLHSSVFIGSLFVPWMARKDERFAWFDCGIVLLFSLSLILEYTGWSIQTNSLWATVFSIDKLFHMTAGACLAIFAMLVLRRRTSDPLLTYAGIIIFALAVGGLWEIFEWVASILPQPFTVPSSGYTDTILDMVADTIGAIIVATMFSIRRYL